jgi:hypothetical protein
MNDENTIINGNENAGPNGETQKAQRAIPASLSRNGKIARLLLAIRQELNQRLQNGEPGKHLLLWLNGLPEVQAVLAAQFEGQPIGQENLSRWKTGSYRRWEAEQTALAAPGWSSKSPACERRSKRA